MDSQELLKTAYTVRQLHTAIDSSFGQCCIQCEQVDNDSYHKWPCDARMLADSIIKTLKRIRNDPQ